MALIPVNITSYDTFRNDVLNRASQGLGYDVDGSYGYQQQCWDLGATLWGNTGDYVYPYLQTGPVGYAYEIWSVSRDINAFPDFDLIYNIADVKRGDMIIIGATPSVPSGHNAFADEDYNGTNFFNLLGQNQVNPNPTTGHIPTINRIDCSAFLGAFRFKRWIPPVPPEPKRKKHKFKWVLYSRKLRNKRNMV